MKEERPLTQDIKARTLDTPKMKITKIEYADRIEYIKDDGTKSVVMK